MTNYLTNLTLSFHPPARKVNCFDFRPGGPAARAWGRARALVRASVRRDRA